MQQRPSTDFTRIAETIIAEFDAERGASRIVLEHTGNTAGNWDANRLSQVLSNLLGNAIQHGGAEWPIRVYLAGEAADRLLVSVHNAGVIPPELLSDLFKPFRSGRVGAAHSNQELGFGLYIVNELVRLHAGHVGVRSNAEYGTTFEIALPRRPGLSSAYATHG